MKGPLDILETALTGFRDASRILGFANAIEAQREKQTKLLRFLNDGFI